MNERGSGLVVMLFMLMLLTLLGAAALQMGQADLEQARLQKEQVRAADLAESGIELAMSWFARPEQFAGRYAAAGPCPAAARADELFMKRCRRASGRLSFVTDDGASQFQGNREAPDGAVTLPASSLFPHIQHAAAGGVEVRIYRPVSRGAVCTVEATGRTPGGGLQTARVELTELFVPNFVTAIESGDRELWPYEELRRLSRRYGRYYTSNRDGRLYLNGQGPPLAADDVFLRSDAAPLIFIDTVDGRPPRSGPDGNMPTLVLSGSAGGSRRYIAGHVVLSPRADDRSAPLGTQFTGGFHLAGQLRVTQESSFFGAVYAAQGFAGVDRLKIEYDRQLGASRLRGWPVVARLQGSWQGTVYK
ncbi:MAG: hypothetical protein AB1515_01065 [Nitrospirota bacterium]